MQIVLLSGGSGTRLWPLSNDARSKQFLRLLPKEGCDEKESMVQRVVRQIREAKLCADVTIATSAAQQDSIIAQLGNDVNIVTEPSRRDTFPAICLACDYLLKEKGCKKDEVIIVMPCDPYTEIGYFLAIERMAQCVGADVAELVLMGIKPSYPSSKYGYVVPSNRIESCDAYEVHRFTEKPTEKVAEQLIAEGAFWNGGVFAFRLGYMTDLADKYVNNPTFEEIRNHYDDFKKISFDYEVAEKATSVAVVPFDGKWKDLGTWNTLTDELPQHLYGNVKTDGTGKNTHVINELDIPIMCVGTENLIIAASPDGILVSEKDLSENIKSYADGLKRRPMYEEKSWGYYKVIDYITYPDGSYALTRQLTINPGCSTIYQKHTFRDEVWTFINGEGELVLDGKVRTISRGDYVYIPKGMKHALRAKTPLSFIEVQSGMNLDEIDIQQYQLDLET